MLRTKMGSNSGLMTFTWMWGNPAGCCAQPEHAQPGGFGIEPRARGCPKLTRSWPNVLTLKFKLNAMIYGMSNTSLSAHELLFKYQTTKHVCVDSGLADGNCRRLQNCCTGYGGLDDRGLTDAQAKEVFHERRRALH